MTRYPSKSPNSIMGVASYLIIKNYNEKFSDNPNGLYYNKIMSLLNRETKKREIDIQLPHCWYRFGDEVIRFAMPNCVEWNHEDPPYTKIIWKGSAPDTLEDYDPSRELKELVSELTEKYAIPEGIDKKAVDEVYGYAPFDFQRLFRNCRENILTTKRSQVEFQDYGKTVIWPSLNEACESFPTDEFSIVGKKIPLFKATVKSILEKPQPNYDLLEELCEEFWYWFCYYLRLHPDAHENVLKETLDIWEEKLEWENDSYEKMLGDHIISLVDNYPDLKSQSILVSESEKRKKIIEHEKEILALFDDDFNEFDDFLKDVKHNYRAK